MSVEGGWSDLEKGEALVRGLGEMGMGCDGVAGDALTWLGWRLLLVLVLRDSALAGLDPARKSAGKGV